MAMGVIHDPDTGVKGDGCDHYFRSPRNSAWTMGPCPARRAGKLRLRNLLPPMHDVDSDGSNGPWGWDQGRNHQEPRP